MLGAPVTAGYAPMPVGAAPMSPGIMYGKPVFGPRVIAFLIDGFIMGGVSSLITRLWVFFGFAGLLLAWFLPILLLVLYKIVMESQMGGQTIGKMLLGLKVVKENLQPITPVDAQNRSLFILLYPFLIPIFLDLISVSEEGQSWGDQWAHTLVVKAQ